MTSDRSSATPPAAPKTKQERIRDNQRRSRARRQEYLADLERRLKESHAACREADLQRAAFADLQAENARLRELLNYAGISPEIVQGFGRQSISSQVNQASSALHRQIKPKYQPTTMKATPGQSSTLKRETTHDSTESATSSTSSLTAASSTLPAISSSVYAGPQEVSFQSTSTTGGLAYSASGDLSSSSTYPWMMAPGMQDSSQASNVSFRGETYLTPPSISQLLPDSGNNTVHSSVAEHLIDRYDPTPSELEEIKTRMANGGYSAPRYPEQGYRVNTQMLFDTMQDMNSRDSQAG
jgi:hypothetical protein